MKKAICMVALAAITFGSVYAAPAGTHNTVQQDSTKKKVKIKDGKKKIKAKTDTSKTKTKVKIDKDKKPPM
jgi:ABC-type transporter MlaC component